MKRRLSRRTSDQVLHNRCLALCVISRWTPHGVRSGSQSDTFSLSSVSSLSRWGIERKRAGVGKTRPLLRVFKIWIRSVCADKRASIIGWLVGGANGQGRFSHWSPSERSRWIGFVWIGTSGEFWWGNLSVIFRYSAAFLPSICDFRFFRFLKLKSLSNEHSFLVGPHHLQELQRLEEFLSFFSISMPNAYAQIHFRMDSSSPAEKSSWDLIKNYLMRL